MSYYNSSERRSKSELQAAVPKWGTAGVVFTIAAFILVLTFTLWMLAGFACIFAAAGCFAHAHALHKLSKDAPAQPRTGPINQPAPGDEHLAQQVKAHIRAEAIVDEIERRKNRW